MDRQKFFSDAQRRPESELRRHMARAIRLPGRPRAQRRPESELRRHLKNRPRSTRSSTLNEGRSLNSGDTWSANRIVLRAEARSTKAGV